MKRSSNECKPSFRLSDFDHRLDMYALAAGAARVGVAAGAGVLASAQASEAKIVYTPAHVVIGSGGVLSYGLDLNHDGVKDFYLLWGWSCEVACRASFRQLPVSPNAAVGYYFSRSKRFDSALKWGARIGSRAKFLPGSAKLVYIATGSSTVNGGSGPGWIDLSGPWANVKNRYLGLKFQIKGKIHYGWARLSVQVLLPAAVAGTLTGYAYETIPNKAIIAGKTKGTDVITGQPGSLGRLARGSAQFAAGRHKE